MFVFEANIYPSSFTESGKDSIAEFARKAHQQHKPRPSILKVFKDCMNHYVKNRHGLKEARAAIDAARATVAALRAENSTDDLISDDDDMEVNSGDDIEEIEELLMKLCLIINLP